ncbi:UNVERIFIED_CONTAM: hypothetical protein FKN15_077809 [Acipenser sinensis]
MSNSHPLRPFTSVAEIDHMHILSEHVGALIQGEEYSDVTFIVEKKRFPTHRVILAARCHYFRVLLYGGMKESQPRAESPQEDTLSLSLLSLPSISSLTSLSQSSAEWRALLYGGMKESQPQAEIPLEDTTAEAFSMLLQYIYTGRVSMSSEREEVLLDFLSLAHRYGFEQLEDSTSEYLRTILNTHNVCLIFDVASLYSLRKLSTSCCTYIDRNATDVLASEGFLSMSKPALLIMVQRDSFAAPEKEIFQALCCWCRHNDTELPEEVMGAVRLPLMSLEEMLNVVRPSGLLSPDALLDAIKIRSESRDMDLNYRGMLIPEENIATMKHGAQVVKGELKSSLLDGDTQNYDLDHGFSRHPIEDDCRSGIEVKLGQPSIINHIRLLLWDRDSRSYSYYIEVSMDELDWVCVVDHSKYLCRSWQNLYFPPRVCRTIVQPLLVPRTVYLAVEGMPCSHLKATEDHAALGNLQAGPQAPGQSTGVAGAWYIRIVGTHNTVNKVFHLVAFECMFTNRPFTLERGLLVASENVATIAACASVIEGVSRSRNALLNGDTKNYDWDSGYTCHQLGSGAIVVQLAQPYMIGSIRSFFPLLWGYEAPLCVCACTVASENVATIAACASVIEGVSRSRNALLNGDTKNYDWDSGYTCHQLGSGAIVVQLAQPYMIGSIRLLLWDCDDRSYSYYIEFSTNQQQWTKVINHTKGGCRLLLWDCDDRSYSYYIEFSTNQQQWTKVINHTKGGCRSVPSVIYSKKTLHTGHFGQTIIKQM